MIGLGIMGSAMSGNLISADYPVVGYDIAAPALAALAGRGGVAAKYRQRGSGESTNPDYVTAIV
jgi:3-hydroxyisobutyrate dehydrogenase-like beta-hydroxyacid dehydrogenase